MSSEPTTEEGTSSTNTSSGHLGVRATWRLTPTAARALLAGVFVNRLAGFLQLFLVLFLTHQGFSPDQAGLALGLYGAGAVLGTFAGGWVSDRLSARSATLISMFGSALLIVAILYLKAYLLVLLAVLLVSAIGQLYRPAAQSLLAELVPAKQLVMVTAMYRLCLNLGVTAAPLLGVALVSVSYDLLFWGEAAAALTYAVIAVRFLPRQTKHATTPAPAEATTTPAPAEETPQPPSDASRGYRTMLADWRYLFYLAAVLLVMLVYSQYTASLPLAIVDAGLNLWWYATVVTLNALIVVTCEVPVTKYVQTWPLRTTTLAGFGLIAIGYGMYAIDIAPFFLVLGTLIWTATEIIGGPTTFAYPGLVAPAGLRGRYFGAMQSCASLGSTVGPIIGVAAWHHLGQTVWLLAAAVGVLSAICARIGMRSPSSTSSAGGSTAPSADADAAPAATPA